TPLSAMGSRGSASRRSASATTEVVLPPDPRWAEELALADVGLVARLMRLDLLVSRVLDEITSAEGVSPSDYVVLGVLRRSPGHASSPTRLCAVLGRSTGGMTLTLDRLEAAGWCTRSADPE